MLKLASGQEDIIYNYQPVHNYNIALADFFDLPMHWEINTTFGTNVWWCKILTNGVVGDFDEENFDKCCCFPVKCIIILLLPLLHALALVAIIATTRCFAHLWITSDKHPEGSGKLSFDVMDSLLFESI